MLCNSLRKLIVLCIFVAFNKAAIASEDLLKGADIDYGEYLSAQCNTCHQTEDAEQTIPKLNGKKAIYLAKQLTAYKTKSLDNEVMQSVAGILSEEEIASLALYFSKLIKSLSFLNFHFRHTYPSQYAPPLQYNFLIVHFHLINDHNHD